MEGARVCARAMVMVVTRSRVSLSAFSGFLAPEQQRRNSNCYDGALFSAGGAEAVCCVLESCTAAHLNPVM